MEQLGMINNPAIELDVVEHKRSFAGHTIYRITLKAYKHGISEPVINIFVWRRYKEFKKLHKELKSIYAETIHGDSFPEFIKANIFGRFEEHIIEERRQSAASFLAYVANNPILYKSNAFTLFFEGAVRNSLYSNQNIHDDQPIYLEESSCDLHADADCSNADNLSEMNENELEQIMTNSRSVTWNNRQSTPELQNNGNIEGNMQYIEPIEPLSDFERCKEQDEAIDSQLQKETPASNAPLPIDRQGGSDEDNDVFSENEDYKEEGSVWLRKAFSVCSEGDDIEKLASEADDGLVLETSRHSLDAVEESEDGGITSRVLKNITDCQNNDLPSDERDESKKLNPIDNETINEKNEEGASAENDDIITDNNNFKEELESLETTNIEDNNYQSQTIMMNNDKVSECSEPDAELSIVPNLDDLQKDDEVSASNEEDLEAANSQTTIEHDSSPEVKSALTFSFDKNMTEKIQKMIEEGDYIYHASFAMSEAIDLEDQRKYETSFEMYKLGIGFLLEGVKRERNEEKRQAVRRKTAQYLLRAESLHKKHLLHSKKCCKSSSQMVNLSEVKSLGIIDNVVLVELKNTDVYIMKILHKCGCEYKNTRIPKPPRDRRFNESKFMVKVLYHAENATGIYLFLEYIPTGLLWNYIDPDWSNNNELLNGNDDADTLNTFEEEKNDLEEERPPEDLVRTWAAEIVIALENLHKSGVICKDLNPRNILLDETGHIKLTYFSNLKGVDYCINEVAVKQSYAAPECRSVFEPTKAADWWSLGAMLFELLTGKSLYSCYPNGIHSHSIINLPKPVSNEAWSLLAGLLRFNPRDRLGAGVAGCEEIKSHRFFSSIDWQELEK